MEDLKKKESELSEKNYQPKYHGGKLIKRKIGKLEPDSDDSESPSKTRRRRRRKRRKNGKRKQRKENDAEEREKISQERGNKKEIDEEELQDLCNLMINWCKE
jgi:hypothetical protein